MNILWRIARAGFRALAATFMAVVVAGAAYWAWTSIQDRRIERVVSQTHDWGEKVLPLTPPVKVSLKTRCSESTLYYRFEVKPNKDADLKPGTFEAIVGGTQFWLHFLDADGFDVMGIEVARFRRFRNDGGEVAGFRANANTSCDKKAYAKAAKWTVAWSPRREQ